MLTETGFALWGNNWDNVNADTPDTGRLGVDLIGTITPVPEPGTFFLFGSGLAALLGLSVRSRRSS